MPSATGNAVAFRLQIAGVEKEFVTTRGMEQTLADGRERIVSLKIEEEQFAIAEKVDIPAAETQADQIQFRLIDVDNKVTDTLGKLPSVSTYLSAELGEASGTINIASTLGWSDDDVAYIGPETVLINSVDSSAKTFSVTRGHWDTKPQTHFTEDGKKLRHTPVFNQPISIKNRRAKVFMYVEGTDDLKGDGRQIWQGIIKNDAKWNHEGWEITIGPTTDLLDQDMGKGLGEDLKPRGIHYHEGNALRVYLALQESAAFFGNFAGIEDDFVVSGSGINGEQPVVIPGDTENNFFESQQDFANELQVAIQRKIDKWATNKPTVKVEPSETFGWNFKFIPDENEALYLRIEAESMIDGQVGDLNKLQWTDPADRVTGKVVKIESGVEYENTQFDNFGFQKDVKELLRSVPRGHAGSSTKADDKGLTNLGVTGSDGAEIQEEHRIHLDGGEAINPRANKILFESPTNPESDTDEAETSRAPLASVNKENNWIEWKVEGVHSVPHGFYFREYNFTFKPIQFLREQNDSRLNTFDKFMDQLTDDSPSLKNAGFMPELYKEDLDFNTFKLSYEEGSRFKSISARFYALGDKMKLSDFVKEEMKMIASYPTLGLSGALTMRPIKSIADTDPDATKIKPENVIVTNERFPKWEKVGDNLIGSIQISTGYHYKEDSHKGRTYLIRDVQAMSFDRNSQQLKIEPKSSLATMGPNRAIKEPLMYEEAVDITAPILGLYGHPYALITLDIVVEDILDIACGDQVKLTIENIPDWEGNFGIKERPALVISRKWLPKMGLATLECIMPAFARRGFSPTFGITNRTLVGTNQYKLDVNFGDPFGLENWANPSNVLSDYLKEGWQVKLGRYNSTTPSFIGAEIDSVDDDNETVTVTVDKSWSLAGKKWFLKFDDFTDVLSIQALRGPDDIDGGYAYWDGLDRDFIRENHEQEAKEGVFVESLFAP